MLITNIVPNRKERWIPIDSADFEKMKQAKDKFRNPCENCLEKEAVFKYPSGVKLCRECAAELKLPSGVKITKS